MPLPLRSDDRQLIQRFAEAARDVSRLAATEGYDIVPYSDPSLPWFRLLPDPQKNHALWQVETLRSLIIQLHAQGTKLRHSGALIWSFLKLMKFSFPTDLMGRFEADDLIDVYNRDHQLIFANLAFFEFLSYPLEDLYCRTWMDLFHREDPGVMNLLIEQTDQVLRGEHPGIASSGHIVPHVTVETASPKKRRALVTPRFVSPLYENGGVAAILCVNGCVPLTDE